VQLHKALDIERKKYNDLKDIFDEAHHMSAVQLRAEIANERKLLTALANLAKNRPDVRLGFISLTPSLLEYADE
jgi:hypothetical protein